MRNNTLQAKVTLTERQVMSITVSGLQRLLGGETIQDGWVCTDALAGLYSPTWVPARPATDIDRAIFQVIQHIRAQAKGATA